MPTSNLTIVIAFLAATIVAAVKYSAWSEKKLSQFFLAEKDLGWIHLCLAVVGADAMVVVVLRAWGGTGVNAFLPMGVDLLSIAVLLTAGGWIVGAYRKSAATTAPGFVQQYSGRATRVAVAAGSLTATIGIRLGVLCILGRLLLVQAGAGDASALLATAIMFAGVAAILGGLRLVAHLQEFCAFVFLLCAGIATVKGFAVPLVASPASPSSATFAGLAGSLITDATLPGIGVGLFVLVVWYWIGDQYFAQYYGGSRDAQEAGRGMRVAGVIKLVVLAGFVFVFCVAPSRGFGDIGIAAEGVRRELSTAMVFSALVAALSGLFTGAASVATLDLLYVKKQGASNRQLVLSGRMATIAFAIIALVWVPVARIIDSQAIVLMLKGLLLCQAPMAAIFLAGFGGRRFLDAAVCCLLFLAWALGAGQMTLEFLCAYRPELMPSWAVVWHSIDVAAIEFLVVSVVLGVRRMRAPALPVQSASGRGMETL